MAPPVETPPPPHSPAGSDYWLQKAIETLGDTVNRRFDEIDQRMTTMDSRFESAVSDKTFKAEVRRLDREVEIAKQERDRIEREADELGKTRAEAVKDSLNRRVAISAVVVSAILSVVAVLSGAFLG